MIRIAIVEDEQMFIDTLREYLDRYTKETGTQMAVTVFRDGADIVEGYTAEFDLILMDIEMPFMDGMKAAREIRKLDEQVCLMFITNMSQYAVRSYEVGATDYILKPIEYFAFKEKFKRALSKLEREHQASLAIPTRDGVAKVAVSDIYFIESQGHYLTYHTVGGDYESRAVMSETEQELSQYGFYRASKGFLVNMRRVDGMEGNDCLVSGTHIPVSRAKRAEFMQQLFKYIEA